MTIQLSPDQKMAVFHIVRKRTTVMLTGDAGSGKTFVTNHAVSMLEASGTTVHRAASTGIAASHIEGETVYRVFGILPTEDGPLLRQRRVRRLAHPGDDVLFVIDEMSMLRVDVLDAIDQRLREWGEPGTPWGGFQMLFVGDWEQLPPVVRGREAASVKACSGGMPQGFAFQHDLWPSVTTIVLTTVHRQADDQVTFKRVLNDVRHGRVTQKAVDWMNRNFKRGPAPPDVIRLCNTKRQMERCNKVLMPTGGGTREFRAIAKGSYKADVAAGLWGDLPLPYKTVLKEGSRIMCKANIPDLGVVNGDLGTLVSLGDDHARVRFDRHGAHDMTIGMHTVQRIEGTEPAKDEETEELYEPPKITGTYQQIPLIPAHAITIHASQGLSLPAAEISMDPDSRFSPAGLLYVALSRVQTLDGVYITYPLKLSQFKRSMVVAREARRVRGAV
jgi:ATP-dependent exoDNAse (exonuclease V) alpha subunit